MAQAWLNAKRSALLRSLPRIGTEVAVRLHGARVDLVIIALLLVIATVPRVVLLGEIPPGLHGDEAIAGLEARRILDSGHIGVYSFQALGVPAGTFYWTAFIFWLIGESVFTLRLAFAVLGILTIPLAYLAFKVMFGRTTATIAALLLATSAWHLHYSRLAFPAVGWPFVEVSTMLALFLAIRYESRLLFGLAGVFLAFGIYTYGAYLIFAVAVGIFLAWLALVRYRDRLTHFVSMVAVLGGMALLVGLPMASYAKDNPDVYTGRYREYSLTSNQEYQDSNLWERGRLIAERELDFVQLIITDPVPDGADAAGIFPLVNRVFLGLIVAGGLVALIRWRSPQHAFLIIGTLIIALGPALTLEAPYRRSIGLTPFLVALAALPLGFVWDTARRLSVPALAVATIVVAAVVGATAAIDLQRYFSTYDDHPVTQSVFAVALAEASRFMAEQPSDTFIYFSSARGSITYESRRFIAPDVVGTDRSDQFGPGFCLELDRPGNVLFLFMDAYLDQAEVVAQRYPGGQAHTELASDGQIMFEAYFLPAAASPGQTALLEPCLPRR